MQNVPGRGRRGNRANHLQMQYTMDSLTEVPTSIHHHIPSSCKRSRGMDMLLSKGWNRGNQDWLHDRIRV
jgi:hypothetical protein